MSTSQTDNAPVNEKNRGGATGTYGPMSPAPGYGPRTDDPVSYQRYFTRIANPGPTLVFRRFFLMVANRLLLQWDVGFRHHGLPLVVLQCRYS